MDPASSPLGGLLAEEITPVVMVLSTILAEESCKKSGLSFVELLRPFTVFQNIDVPVRTASDLPYRLQSFRVRMVYASDVQQPDHEAVINNLKEVVTNASENTEQATGSRENSLSDLHSEPPPLEDLLSMSESEIQPLWFRTFNEGLSQAVSYSDHEAFDHPVACLLVVSPKDKLPMNTFVDLFNTNQLPPILNDGAMDPKILKHYLLLHDNQDDTVEKSAGILSEMRSTLGLQNCRLLCINSAMDETMEWKENPWAFCKTNMNCHCLLNLDDFNEIKEFMQDLTSKKIIPYMEQKIRILNQQISATRKGFKNQIKNLWWRKGKEDTSDAPDGSMYTFSSIESQIRVLGDYAFMLRDYELALSNYRLLSTDYKLDKAWKRYAGSQEMVGLSLFMLDQSRKDSEYCMENAFSTYLKLGSSGLKNATRCGIWWAEMLKAWAQHKEAASVYFRISNEEPSSHAAVLLEQSSYCYLFSNPPMLRKFGFHLVLAGNRYFISDQRKHAIRTYRIALSVYKGNTWSYINDHVHFNIGRWYAFYKMFDAAIKHMLEVLECTHQSLTTQDLFLRDFFQIVQNMGRKLEVVKLQLPSVNMSSLKVIFEDYRTYASSAAVHVKESVWQSLEENFVPPITTVKSNWLESGKLFQPKKDNDDSISVVGEAIKVHLEFKNPLQISIYISAASLVCKQSVRPATVESGECTQTKDFHNNVVQEMFSSNRDQKDDTSLFDLSEHDFVLGGGETKEVQLEVTPKTEGYLKIIGVTWTLSGHVVGCHNFDLNLKKKNKKKRAVELFPRQSMSFIVVKGLPKLEGNIHHLPKDAYSGELRLVMLELRNKSCYAVKKMKMKINHPRFLIPGSPGELEFPDCLRKGTRLNSVDLQEHSMENLENHLFSFPSDAEIPGDSVFKWPFWLHTADCGHISLYLSLYYEVENCDCDMEYRTLRMNYDLEVLPSLDVSISITPCTSKLQEFLVRMDVASRTSSESFWLCQLSTVGHQWEISSLPAYASVCPSQLLLAGQTSLCFFKLKDLGQKVFEKNTSSVYGSDVHLGSEEDDQVILDVSKTPLESFHHQERLHQGKFLQKFPASVDFVLISQLVGDDAMPESGEHARLLSHHLCHRSIASKCPIWWIMHGPQRVSHDFSVPFCEVNFHVTICNCSEAMASVKIATFDSIMSKSQSRDEPPPSDFSVSQAGWHDISLVNDVNVSSDTLEARDNKDLNESIISFQWCALSSTQVELAPMSSAIIPLQICLFSPGIYDLSSYELQWNLQCSPANGCASSITWQLSGKNKGHPFYLAALQSSI